MNVTDVQLHQPNMADANLDTSRHLPSHLQGPEANTLITAAFFGMQDLLKNLRESGLFCRDEINEALMADSKTITVSKDQLIIKWVKIGINASEIRQLTITQAYEKPEES